MSCVTPTSLRGALDALAADPGALGARRRHRRDGRGQHGPSPPVVGRRRRAGGRAALVDCTIPWPARCASVPASPTARCWPSRWPRCCPHWPRRRARSARRRSATRRRSAATSARRRRPATGCRCSPRSTRSSTSQSAVGTRDVPFAEFAVGPKRTVRRPGELITAVTVPVLSGWQGYAKVGVRNAMVIATATCCLAVDVPTRLGAHRPRLGRTRDHPCRRGRGVRRGQRRPRRRAGLGRGGRAHRCSWPPRRRGRSTTTAPRPSTGGTRSACSRHAWHGGPSRMSEIGAGNRQQPGVPAARQRASARGARRLGRREPALRAARAARADGQQGRVRAGRVRLVQRAGRRRAGVQLPGAGGLGRGLRRSSRSRASPRRACRATCSRRSSTPARCSAASARRA